MKNVPEYLPICTTILASVFFIETFRHYKHKRKEYLLWWIFGFAVFVISSITESINVLWGWHEANMKCWYIFGGLLGGFTLAQGMIYFLIPKKVADVLTIIMLSIITMAIAFVIFSPTHIPQHYNGKLNGSVLECKWIRIFSLFINLYAFFFLFGGALYSAYKYWKVVENEIRFQGNILIAVGALLPGIGSTFTRLGNVNVLFVTELFGLILIYYGYKRIKIEPITKRI